MTALVFGSQYGHLLIAELLVEAGADIEAKPEALGSD